MRNALRSRHRKASANGFNVMKHWKPLSQEESARFIDRRIMWAGGDGWEHIYTRQAMELICLVSDGSPRCLEQLAGRSLQWSASTARESQVTVEAVRSALDLLKELPLCWNEPSNLDSYSTREQQGEMPDIPEGAELNPTLHSDEPTTEGASVFDAL